MDLQPTDVWSVLVRCLAGSIFRFRGRISDRNSDTILPNLHGIPNTISFLQRQKQLSCGDRHKLSRGNSYKVLFLERLQTRALSGRKRVKGTDAPVPFLPGTEASESINPARPFLIVVRRHNELLLRIPKVFEIQALENPIKPERRPLKIVVRHRRIGIHADIKSL